HRKPSARLDPGVSPHWGSYCTHRGVMDVRERAKQILDYAVATETADKEFYSRWAERCDIGDVKQLLEELADEERRHIEKLSNISPEALIAEGRAPVEIGFVMDVRKEDVEREMAVLDVLSVAIKREEKAVTLYQRMREASTIQRSLFGALVEEERRHKYRLELKYASLRSRTHGG
ncbi:ferritin family protein, partial [Candidatus Bipolaricaulota bacterium]